jgi:transcriptional regulator with XRE-family HTH domain
MKMISPGAAKSLVTSQTTTQVASASTSRLAKRLAGTPRFWVEWFRRPALDAAESIIRLRRLRGVSQAQLAKRMKTKQPAIARLESGRGNIELETLVKAAKALGAVVRLDMEPEELLGREPLHLRWWDREAVINPFGSEPPKVSVQFNVNSTTNVLVVAGSSSEAPIDDADWDFEDSIVQVPVPEDTLAALAQGASGTPSSRGSES